ncbi:hypothetical protein LPA06_17150 [Lacticaseibacillus paracasei subsp. tolerans]|nr:hypothetical protein LPA06_17150 [Lacticaseibacillus paracasei subsp. tolerans]
MKLKIVKMGTRMRGTFLVIFVSEHKVHTTESRKMAKMESMVNDSSLLDLFERMIDSPDVIFIKPLPRWLQLITASDSWQQPNHIAF